MVDLEVLAVGADVALICISNAKVTVEVVLQIKYAVRCGDGLQRVRNFISLCDGGSCTDREYQ